jgi:hypothetical protein
MITPVIESEQKATIVNDNAAYYTSALNFESSKRIQFNYIFAFQGQGKKFILKYPVPCYFYEEEDSLIGECHSLGLISNGESEQEIRDNFDLDFDFLYSNYFLEPNENLTKDAKRLKELLENIIGSVE